MNAEIVESFGQLFMMAYDGKRIAPDVAEFFRAFRIGGVILFRDNYESPAQLRDVIAELQRTCAPPNCPLFVATDHEGGRVQRFRDGFTRIPPMGTLVASPDSEVEAIHRTIARELRAVGINIDLAPCADVLRADTTDGIGDRSFGTDPKAVADRVVAAIRGLQSEGMIACAKHFPGHGGTKQDSHDELPVSELDLDSLAACDLVPFKAAIAAGVDSIMTAHVLYPQRDRVWPASLSPFWITELLRERLGFEGVVISDAIEMRALRDRWTPEHCGFRALCAGTDVVVYYREPYQFEAFLALRAALEDGDLNARQVAASIGRVRALKQRRLTA